MKTTQVISFVLLFAGIAILLFSIVMGLKIKLRASTKIFRKWIFSLSFIGVLLLGYVFYFSTLLLKIELQLEIVTSSLLLGGAASFLIIIMFTRGSIDNLQKEINGRKQVEAKMKGLLLVDQLTGLYNRKGFFTLVKNHMEKAKREDKKIILIYADVNGLKSINNKYGRQEGDMMLLGTANNMKSTFRKSDIIARIGSDEFVVFLAGAAQESVGKIIDRFKQSITIHNSKKHRKYELSIDIVLLKYDSKSDYSVDDMLAQANELMYKTKRSGEKELITKKTDKTDPEDDGNFILFVNNLSDEADSFDLKINIDGKAVVDEDSYDGSQHAWKPYQFSLTKNRHKIKVESMKGKARLEEEFEIRTKHMAVIEYSVSSEGKSNSFSFNIQDV
ncbi:MAG: GGDEF domain-containing protein [Nitrospirota bacterium]